MAIGICTTGERDTAYTGHDWDVLAKALPGYTTKEVGSTTKEEIQRLAYLKWEAAGKPSGKDAFFWMEAERELLLNNR